MPWGPRASAMGNPNMYMPSGSGRDFIIVRDEEHRLGKNRPVLPADRGNSRSPARVPGRGPPAPTQGRLEDMFHGIPSSRTPKSQRKLQPLFPRATSEPELRKGFELQSRERVPQERERILMQVGGPCFFSDPMNLHMYLDGSHTGTMASPAGL
mmetsp:Transcript_6335/g.15245  ORF Transcript_6335/g.15245 Transcript_6335/m.15245 type:complete len:154 (+) Transcript_6335:89-550(+)